MSFKGKSKILNRKVILKILPNVNIRQRKNMVINKFLSQSQK